MSQHGAGKGAAPKRNPLQLPEGINKRCDLPPEAYWHADKVNTPHATRPGYSTGGQNIKVGVNQFQIKEISGKDICQYDVAVLPEPKGMIVYKKAWNCKAFQRKLAEMKAPWLHDSRKLAWSSANIPSFSLKIDLGEDEGRPGRSNQIMTVEVKQTCKVRMEALKGYLEKKIGWDNSVLECISFLDHALRQGPSERMRLIKRTLFNDHSETRRLNAATEAIKGIYSAIRLNNSSGGSGVGLGVNVDVSNQTFWIGQKFEQLARSYLSSMDRKWENLDYAGMGKALLPVKTTKKDGSPTWGMSEAFKILRRLQNIRFTVNHRGSKDLGNKEYKVKGFLFDAKYGSEGSNAKVVTFTRNMPDGNPKEYSVYDYYLQQYRHRVQHWYLPLVESTNGGFFPMEVCDIGRFNPFPFKLDPNQTSEMIKFAVQRPPQRKTEVMRMVQNLDWGKDRYLSHFGIKIDPTMPTIPAKLLPNPIIQFGNKTVDPKMAGRWDLRGVKFVAPNKLPLVAWAFVIVDGCVDQQSVQHFADAFKTAYAGHGGRISSKPMIMCPPRGLSPAAIVGKAYNDCGRAFKQDPQIIFYILPSKAAGTYEHLKQHNECNVACLTQMLQGQHVRKCQPQYCSNVAMKVNAKLGGRTSRIAVKGNGPAFFGSTPTMMIGLDLSHGATGTGAVSTAAMCVSMDAEATYYNAAVQTNGWGVEILQPANMHSMLGPLADKWRKTSNKIPQHVFYLRDGVSEGQYAHVMEFEVAEMKKVFKDVLGTVPKITVIIATKRHHIRFFPERGDKNGNCLPGTLVEREVTHPFHYDFYLCSHVAIQGTARPVHYSVIHDECGLKPDELQRILYHQCYQYCRSTTPVSLHPAVYYAHLAGARARAHENTGSNAEPANFNSEKHEVLKRPGPMSKGDKKQDNKTITTSSTEAPPPFLLRIGQFVGRESAIKTFTDSMWWV
ncbi:Piwi domain-containing protein [Chaetomium sp. MPI-SDFR-AT-0129]|nr:Piwi domain-containing protein [Chaetomium sp. MPI-SDFR-AT-0129]